jgi:hypothetical protein
MSNSRIRGRIGGYGRTGQFVNTAKRNKWYTIKQILRHFHDCGDMIIYAQAKSVFEAIDRAKCHRTKKKYIDSCPEIMLLPVKPRVYEAPDYLLKICNSSIHNYLLSLLLYTSFNKPHKTVRKEYLPDSKELKEIVRQQDKHQPITFDDLHYSIAGCDLLDGRVRVIFKQNY